MTSYRDILAAADAHFQEVARTQGAQLQCGRGCSFCCYGLFEIASSDVAILVEGLLAADPTLRADIVKRARQVMSETAHPDDLRSLDPDEKEAFFDRTSGVACPILGSSGECRLYEHRPLVCRTFGLPLRNGDEYIGDICDLNFRKATDQETFSAAWNLEDEDAVSADDQYTIPEAILLADRISKKTK